MEHEWQRPGLRRHASTTSRSSTSTPPTPRALGRDARRPGDGGRRRRQHRHGQRQLPRAVDPPDDRGVAARRLDPHRRSSPATPAAPEGDRAVLDGAKAHGHDRRRPLAATRRRSTRSQAAFDRRPTRPRRRAGRTARPLVRGPRRPRCDGLRSAAVTVYVAEEFTPDEADVLRRYFTNLDGPVFALVNLPEVVKGALFARYSRSPKSLRRLFLDEFVGDLDITRRPTRSTPPSACAGPRSSTTGSSSSTATTRWPSSAASTWPASRRRTCSPRCSSGAG